MGNTYTDKLKMRMVDLGDQGWDDEVNDNIQILEVLLASIKQGNSVISGLAPSDGGGLDVDYAVGGADVDGSEHSISGSSKTCTASVKNWLYVDSSGVMQISTSAPTGQYLPIAMIDAGASALDRIADLRYFTASAVADLRKLNFNAASELTISSGAITITQSLHRVDGEGDAADDLATINGGTEGDLLILYPENAARNITLKHGTGNIVVDTGADYTIPDNGLAILIRDASNWRICGLDLTDYAKLTATNNFADNIIQRANFKDCGIVTNAIGSIGGGAQTIDIEDGNSVSATVDTSETTFTFSTPTASDELCVFSLILTNGGSQTVNWPASVDWEGGTAPTLTTSGVDILVFTTIDGGTTWHGSTYSVDSQ